MTNLKSLNISLESLQAELTDLQSQLESKQTLLSLFEIDPDDYIEDYENCLDECNGEFMGMSASYILKECDPIAYRWGLNDYCDSIDLSTDSEYHGIEEEIEELEEAISNIESEIEEIENDIEELENEEA